MSDTYEELSALGTSTLTSASNMVYTNGGPGFLAAVEEVVEVGLLAIGNDSSISGTDSIYAEIGGDVAKIPVSDIFYQDFSTSLNGTFTNGQKLFTINIARAMQIDANMASSLITGTGTTTTNSTLTLEYNGTGEFTCVLASGASPTTPSTNTGSLLVMAAGGQLSLVATTVDAGLETLSPTIVARRL